MRDYMNLRVRTLLGPGRWVVRMPVAVIGGLAVTSPARPGLTIVVHGPSDARTADLVAELLNRAVNHAAAS